MANINPTTPQLRLVKAWLDSYLALDIKRIEPLISKDYSFKSYPKVADHPDETKGLHTEKWGAVLSVLSKSEVDIHEVIEAPGKVVLHQTFQATLVDGTKYDYGNVTIISIVMEGSELKINEVKEFPDPDARREFHAAVAKALEKGAP